MAGYIRQSTFVDGDTITAALFNDEYNQLVNAFSNTSGHKHDGTTAEGPVIGLIGDAGETSPNNKVLIDTTNNYIEFYVEVSSAPVQQIYIADGAIIPVTDNDIDLGTSSLEFKDIYIDGTATIDTLTVDEAATVGTTLGVTGATTLSSTLGVTGATTLSSTLAVTGATTLSSTLAVTGTSTLTGNVTATNDLSVGGNLTVTGNATISGNLTFGDADTDSINLSAEIDSNIVPNTDDTYDLGTSTKQWRNLYIDGTAEIDTLAIDGTTVTSTAAELNILDGVTSTAAELNILDGVTSTTAELNILDGVTATAAEINLLDGVTSTTAELNILDGVTATATEINLLDGVTSTTAELNILDGVTSTATELNIVDGDTAATSTTLADADRVVVNDAGTMKQVALTDFETYFEGALDTLSNVTTVGALNSGSITSGFGAIDNGSSAITTTGTVTYGSLSDGTITITAFVDEDDMSSNSATLVPTQQSVKAYVDTTVAATNEVVEDSTPQLGGDLDTNGSDILFGDNDKAIFGAGSDLQIYHDGSNSYIKDAGTGNLNIQANQLRIQSDTGENFIECVPNAQVVLRYDNDVKLQTTSTGIDVTGGLSIGGTEVINSSRNLLNITNLVVDNIDLGGSALTVASGDFTVDVAGDIILDADGGDIRFRDGGTEVGTIVMDDGSNTFIFKAAQSDADIKFNGNDGGSGVTALTLDMSDAGSAYFNNKVGIGTTSPYTLLELSSTDPIIRMTDSNGVADKSIYEMRAIGASGSESLEFRSVNDANSVYNKLLVLKHGGNVGIGTDSPTNNLVISDSGGAGLEFIPQTSNDRTTLLSYDRNTSTYQTIDFDGSDIHFNVSGNEKARIDSSGNVGIGTTVTNALGWGSIAQIGGANPAISLKNSSNVQWDISNFGGTFNIYNGSNPRFRIDSSGNVGIGTSSPADRFHVALDSSTTNAEVDVMRVEASSSGTPAVGFGPFIDFRGDRITGGVDAYGRIGFEADAMPSTQVDGAFVIQPAEDGTYTERFRVSSDGKVGIGTSSPDKALTISASDSQIRLYDSDGTNQFASFQSDNGITKITSRNNTSHGQIAFQRYNGTTVNESVRIDSSGNVGIGETSPEANLHVKNASAGTFTASNSQLLIENNTTVRLTMVSPAANACSIEFGDIDDQNVGVITYDHSGNYMNFKTNAADAMRIDSRGGVVIGDTSIPQYTNLKVYQEHFGGMVNIGHSNTGGTFPKVSAIGMGSDAVSFGHSTNNGTVNLSGSAQIAAIQTASSGAVTEMAFYTTTGGSVTERMRIDSSGNLLLGGTSQLGKFTCHNGGSDGVYVNGTGTGYVYRTSNTTGLAGYFVTSSGAAGSISVSGTSTTYNTSSDARLKDVTGSARGLEVINELNPVSYNWKADGKADEGLIAQEVKEIVPNAVSGSEEEMYQMDYSKLVVHLVKAVKEQQTQIEALQSEINELKNS